MKRFFSAILSGLLILSLIPIPAYAVDTNDVRIPIEDEGDTPHFNGNQGNISAIPRGMREASPEVIEQWRATHDEMDALLDNPCSSYSMEAATWTQIDNPHYYGQQYETSCGPACVRMALMSLTGTHYEERVIRKGCNWTETGGTLISDLCPYLNAEQNIYAYTEKYSTFQFVLNNGIYNAICDGAPPLIGISPTEEDGWYKASPGHIIVVYAALSDKSTYKIMDPWGGFIGDDSLKWYDVGADKLYIVYNPNIGFIA